MNSRTIKLPPIICAEVTVTNISTTNIILEEGGSITHDPTIGTGGDTSTTLTYVKQRSGQVITSTTDLYKFIIITSFTQIRIRLYIYDDKWIISYGDGILGATRAVRTTPAYSIYADYSTSGEFYIGIKSNVPDIFIW